MKLIIKLSPEIIIKSQSVRLRFIKILTRNIRNVFRHYKEILTVTRYWDYIEILVKDASKLQTISNMLTNVPGIHHILDVEDTSFISLQDILEKTLLQYRHQIAGKTFCVRIKRKGKHTFNSIEAERYIGKGLNQHVNSSRVNLTNPEVTINLEIKNNRFLLIKKRYHGIGGFPIGTQEEVLSLISGGFDSGVSSYMLIRRGCKVHYCFFNIGGIKHEIGVRQIAYYLWNRFSYSHYVRFITINFEPVISEIIKKIDNSQMGVILKRMMIRTASKIAEQHNIQAIVTGEALGQVSSQTLTNLCLINNVSDKLIIRPLISYDKDNIIHISREIGINNIIHDTSEYCSIISKKPTIKAVQSKIEVEEKNFDFSILDKVIKEAVNMDIRTIVSQMRKEISTVETTAHINANDVIIDIRSTSEQHDKPLKITGIEIISMPFYKLNAKFSELNQHKTYLLWCEHGVMSYIQALYLREQGFMNVKIYRQ